ncbi:MAG: hypothetical protein QOK00_1612 [Thermoleophilaceae bacterium]|nr:hypothetical protein [Thermoleophilaceae bacterium]MEA2401209.1 hypothetical protein [Thermoleophilaceae bacterium]
MTELPSDPRQKTNSSFLLAVGDRGVGSGNPPLICTVGHTKDLGLAPLRHSDDLIKPTHHVLDRSIFGHWLSLSESGHQEPELLEADTDGTTLFPRVTLLDRAERL